MGADRGGPKRGHTRGNACGHPSVPSGGLGGTPTARDRGMGRAHPGQRGSVTAEVAVVLPALVVLLALLLGTAHVGTVQLQLEEAARAGAREAMRGESSESVERTVRRLAGSNATASVAFGSGWTTVEVRVRVEGPVVELMGIELTATASGKEEDGG
jgi:Flp pilus assembly protein TadG